MTREKKRPTKKREVSATRALRSQSRKLARGTTPVGPERVALRHGDKLAEKYTVVSTADGASAGDPAKPIGSGGTSLVYRVRHELFPATGESPASEIIRAVKILALDEHVRDVRARGGASPSGKGDFRLEAAHMAAMSHENLVGIIDAGTTSTRNATLEFIVLEYVDPPTTLEDVVRSERWAAKTQESPWIVVTTALELCRPVHYLHTHSIFHRDIAPKNVFCALRDDDDVRVRLGDLGLGMRWTPSDAADEPVWVAGSHEYMPEELGMQYARVATAGWLGPKLFFGDMYAAGRTIEYILSRLQADGPLPRPLAALQLIATRMTTASHYSSMAHAIRDIEKLTPAHLITAQVPELPSSRAVQNEVISLPGGDVHLTARLKAVVDHSTFQALKNIPQIQFASEVLPGAVHTRFEHSLGCLRNMQFALLNLTADDVFYVSFGPEDYECALLCALLSSLHCVPLFHVFQELARHGIELGPLASVSHALRRKFDVTARDHSLRAVITHHFGEDVLDRVEALIDGVRPLVEKRRFVDTVIRRLLDSSFDVRVCDYLVRDQHHLGARSGMTVTADEIYSRMSVDAEDGEIVLDESAVPYLEQLICAKFWMFEHVYWSVPNRAAIAMVAAPLAKLQRVYAERNACGPDPFVQLALEREMKVPVRDAPREVCIALIELGHADAALILGCFSSGLRHYGLRLELTEEELGGPALGDVMAGGGLLVECREFVAQSLGLPSFAILVDVPGVLKRRAGDDVFVKRRAGGARVDLRSVSGLVEGLSQNFERRIRRLRVFVHPDHHGDVTDAALRTYVLRWCRSRLDSIPSSHRSTVSDQV